MDKIQQTESFNRFTSKMFEKLLSKGDDYSNADRLSNFKISAAVINSTPELTALTLIATKVARLGTLLTSQEEAKNESIEDSILDLANYAVLLNMILEDKLKTVNTEKNV